MTPMETNQRVFDQDVAVFTDMSLMPAERSVLRRLAPRIHALEMLDLGVGTGRVGWTSPPWSDATSASTTRRG